MATLVLLTAPAMLLRSIARASAPRRWASSALRGCAAIDHGEVVAAAERRCSAEPAALAAIRAETDTAFPSGAHMVSGAQQGRLLHALVRLARARRVLEIGSFTGYATLWMALGMEAGGRLIALERDERAAAVARRHLAASYEAGTSAERVEIIVDDAMDAIAALPADEPPFDLIFLDADKKRYPEYVDLLLERGLLAPHGLLLADNVLWKGRVLELLAPECAAAADAVDGRERRSLALRDALHGFNVRVAADPRLHGVLLPLRDGLFVLQAAGGLEATGDPAAAASDAALPTYLRLVGGTEPAALAELGVGGAPLQGRLLHALVRRARARRVLEVGASTGYATRWMELGMEEGGCVVAGDDAAGAEPPFDLVVWHVGDAGAGDLPAVPDLLAPHGLLVVVQPTADGAAAAAVHDALAEGPLEYVTLPSPDGDGGVLTLAMSRIL